MHSIPPIVRSLRLFRSYGTTLEAFTRVANGAAEHTQQSTSGRPLVHAAVCRNHNLWPSKTSGRSAHSKFATFRFNRESAPALSRLPSPLPFLSSTTSSGTRTDHSTGRRESHRFLRKGGFSASETAKLSITELAEEGRKPESIFDSYRASRKVPATNPIRTLGSIWKHAPRSCSTG